MIDLTVDVVADVLRSMARFWLGVLCFGAAFAIAWFVTLPALVTAGWPDQAVTVGGDCRSVFPDRTDCLATWRAGTTTIRGSVEGGHLVPGSTVTARVDGDLAYVPRPAAAVVLWTVAAVLLLWFSPKPWSGRGGGSDGSGGSSDGGGYDGGDGGGDGGGGGGGGGGGE
jgi:uncharacterized membrane protein YgcG